MMSAMVSAIVSEESEMKNENVFHAMCSLRVRDVFAMCSPAINCLTKWHTNTALNKLRVLLCTSRTMTASNAYSAYFKIYITISS